MWTVVFRTAVAYFALIAGVRLMGKRELGQLEPSEFVVGILMADIATVPVADPEVPVLAGVLPVGLIVAGELGLSWLAARSTRLRRLLCGKPVILIDNGRICQRELKSCRISLDELTGQLRLKDVLDLTCVQYAILETSGELSVFLYPEQQPPSAKDQGIPVDGQSLPVTIIEDGRILGCNLPLVGKDHRWVHRVLKDRNTSLRDTFLLTVDQTGHILWIGKE